jgi:glycosyltransferase involved in cell wall biosynthesis
LKKAAFILMTKISITYAKDVKYGSATFGDYLRYAMQKNNIRCEKVVGLRLKKVLNFWFDNHNFILLVHPSIKYMLLLLFVSKRVVITHHNCTATELNNWNRIRSNISFWLCGFFYNVSVSQFVADTLPFHSEVIRNRVPGSIFSTQLTNTDALKQYDFGFFASLRNSKGLDVFLNLVEQLPDYTFLICGDGECRDAVESAVVNLKNLTYVGFVAPADVHERMRSCKVAICPYIAEPFGLTPLEAYLCGCNIVYRHEGGLIEAMQGLHCYPVEGSRLSDWADASLKALAVGPTNFSDDNWQFSDHLFAKDYHDYFISIS